MAIFVGFLFLISRWKDIRRVFEYHGAEHKVVFNYESGTPVNIENAQAFTTYHPRCGTSFLLVVMLVSMVVYTLIPFDGFALKLLSRVVLLPVIAGISYEMIRFAAKRRGSVLSTLTAPGLWLQRITTQPPSDAGRRWHHSVRTPPMPRARGRDCPPTRRLRATGGHSS